MKRNRIMASTLALSIVTAALVAGPASAAPKPVKMLCDKDPTGAVYACLGTADTSVPSGETVTFTGTLSKAAMKNLNSWTRGDNIVCLDRFKTTPEADGSWPWQMMEGACTTVRKDGGFTIRAEFGRKGTFYYGVEMGPCRAGADECGNADPGLVIGNGAGTKVLRVKTT
jgi:hypothetical protein